MTLLEKKKSKMDFKLISPHGENGREHLKPIVLPILQHGFGIVERQKAKDLERGFQHYLSLNTLPFHFLHFFLPSYGQLKELKKDTRAGLVACPINPFNEVLENGAKNNN